MENKYYKVVMEIEAPDVETVDKMIDRIPRQDRILDCDIIDPDENRYECRIRYDEDWNGRGECFVFEGKWTDEDEWGLDTAYALIDDKISYEALTKIRELMRNGVHFYFSQG